jgi:hypothetical protein
MSTGFLRGINAIHGQVVRHENDLVQHSNEPGAENAFIVIDYGENSIKFQLQNGSRDDISKPGVHLESIAEVVRVILEVQTDQYPCPELECALNYLDLAIKQMARWTAYRNEHGAAGCIKHRRDGEQRCEE